ncbi:MAG: c-type cytochrome [Pyrinomonadaceae bacterium]
MKCAAVLAAAAIFTAVSCQRSGAARVAIAESKKYEASLYRQHCAICHGVEAEGKVLTDGRRVPSLREGEFKAKNQAQIYNQIANGGNGMVAFRSQLSQREIEMMTAFVLHDLRGQ